MNPWLFRLAFGLLVLLLVLDVLIAGDILVAD